MTHGGARPGAGRKKKENNVYLAIRVDAEVADYIRRIAMQESISYGAVIERMVQKEMEGRQ